MLRNIRLFYAVKWFASSLFYNWREREREKVIECSQGRDTTPKSRWILPRSIRIIKSRSLSIFLFLFHIKLSQSITDIYVHKIDYVFGNEFYFWVESRSIEIFSRLIIFTVQTDPFSRNSSLDSPIRPNFVFVFRLKSCVRLMFSCWSIFLSLFENSHVFVKRDESYKNVIDIYDVQENTWYYEMCECVCVFFFIDCKKLKKGLKFMVTCNCYRDSWNRFSCAQFCVHSVSHL